jgi:hypothetical protein
VSTKALESALEKLDSLKGVGNPWTKAAYQELYRLRRASDVVTAILDGNTHRNLDDWQRARTLLSAIGDERPISGSLTPASTSEATEHQAAARRTPEMEVPVTLSIETGEAEANLAKLRASIEAVTEAAEKLNALNLPTVAAQNPQARYETIRQVQGDLGMNRLTLAQAYAALYITLGVGALTARALLEPEPYAQEQVPRTPEKPSEGEPPAPLERRDVITDGGIGNLAARHGIDLVTPEQWATKGYPVPPEFKESEEEWHAKPIPDQRGFWWFKMSGGSMSDMSTEKDLRDFILNGGTHGSEERRPTWRDAGSLARPSKPAMAVAVNVSGEDVLINVDPTFTIGQLKRVALDASKHRIASGLHWQVFDMAGLRRQDHEIVEAVLGNLRAEEWCLSLRSPQGG